MAEVMVKGGKETMRMDMASLSEQMTQSQYRGNDTSVTDKREGLNSAI